MSQFPKRAIDSKSAYPQIVVWHYDRQNFGLPANITGTRDDADDFFKATQFTIDDGIISLGVSKSLDSASASFDFELLPTENWKAKISPGDWLAIFMTDKYDNGNYQQKNLILLGNVDKVNQRIARNEDDTIETKYSISGRNFGKVFEDTHIWFDPYTIQDKTLDAALRSKGLALTGSPNELFSKALDIFLGPGTEVERGRTSPLSQWRISSSMASFFGAARDTFVISESQPTFYDILNIEQVEDLPGYRINQMISAGDGGNLWDMIQKSSNRYINEVIVEESRNGDLTTPTIRLRPRPISTPFLSDVVVGVPFAEAVNNSAILDVLSKSSQTMQSLASDDANVIVLDPTQIKETSLGKDDHSRFNMLWLSTQSTESYNLSPMTHLEPGGNIGNPTYNRIGIQRHGLRKIDDMMEFCNKAAKSKFPNLVLMKAFMSQIYDFHFANHLYDSGVIESTGFIEAELGKVLLMQTEGGVGNDKIYYIEGYEHRWSFPNLWTTSFSVTHGQYLASDSKIFIDATDDDQGKLDRDSETIFLAQTQFKRQAPNKDVKIAAATTITNGGVIS